MDLATAWRGRRWRKLLSLIDALPRNSHFYQALLDDEQVAASILDAEDDSPGSPRRMAEWSYELEMLTNIFDRQGEQIAVAMAAAGVRKPARPKPAPRPKTGVDRVRARRRENQTRRLAAVLIPAARPLEENGQEGT